MVLTGQAAFLALDGDNARFENRGKENLDFLLIEAEPTGESVAVRVSGLCLSHQITVFGVGLPVACTRVVVHDEASLATLWCRPPVENDNCCGVLRRLVFGGRDACRVDVHNPMRCCIILDDHSDTSGMSVYRRCC